jgi:KDO2-lipid IV(A) lauroyltransferase
MLPDQVPGKGEGAWVPFFGRPAYTMTLAARLAETGATVLMAYAERLHYGAGYHLKLFPLSARSKATSEQRAAQLNRELEALVRLCPEQYLWGYNRYKVPHFAVLGRSLLELGLWWWASPERIKRLVRLEGEEHLQAHQGKPVILLAPHFVALDAGGARLNIDYAMVSIYARAKNRVFDGALRRGRERFGKLQLVARTDGVSKVLRPLRAGTPFYYLPDMDYGRHDAVFVPFFGYPAATITGLSRLAKISGAVVLPVITRMVDDHYVTRIGEAWTGFPTDDVTADTRRMNAYLETEIMKSPEQYYWLHKRFKTRPRGEQGVY